MDAAKVIERIRKLHRQRPLASTGDVRRRDSRLYDRCYHYFGGVVPAVEAAGIPYVRLSARRSRRWTKQIVIRTIQVLDADGSSFPATAMSESSERPSEQTSGRRRQVLWLLGRRGPGGRHRATPRPPGGGVAVTEGAAGGAASAAVPVVRFLLHFPRVAANRMI